VTNFNIGNQNAASIQNIGGDATVHELSAELGSDALELRRELAALERGLAEAAVPGEWGALAARSLATAAAEAGRPDPDRRRVARLLEQATRTLGEAGALSAAGASLVDSIRRTANVLGPAGKTVLALLALL
jgi:hypothetical protein